MSTYFFAWAVTILTIALSAVVIFIHSRTGDDTKTAIIILGIGLAYRIVFDLFWHTGIIFDTSMIKGFPVLEISAWALFAVVLWVAFFMLLRESRTSNASTGIAILFLAVVWTFLLPLLWLAEKAMR